MLKTCRCCCATIRLEKAAKVIGIVFTILGAISIVTWAVKLSQFADGRDQLERRLGDQAGNEDIQNVLNHAHNMLVAHLCTSILFTLFSAILVAGVYKRHRCLVLTFVIFFALYLALLTITTFYSFYDPSVYIDDASIAELNKQSPGMATAVIYTTLAIMLVIFAFFWYLAAVVYSYYKEMTGASSQMV